MWNVAHFNLLFLTLFSLLTIAIGSVELELMLLSQSVFSLQIYKVICIIFIFMCTVQCSRYYIIHNIISAQQMLTFLLFSHCFVLETITRSAPTSITHAVFITVLILSTVMLFFFKKQFANLFLNSTLTAFFTLLIIFGGFWVSYANTNAALWSWDPVELVSLFLLILIFLFYHVWGRGFFIFSLWLCYLCPQRLFRFSLANSSHHLTSFTQQAPLIFNLEWDFNEMQFNIILFNSIFIYILLFIFFYLYSFKKNSKTTHSNTISLLKWTTIIISIIFCLMPKVFLFSFFLSFLVSFAVLIFTQSLYIIKNLIFFHLFIFSFFIILLTTKTTHWGRGFNQVLNMHHIEFAEISLFIIYLTWRSSGQSYYRRTSNVIPGIMISDLFFTYRLSRTRMITYQNF